MVEKFKGYCKRELELAEKEYLHWYANATTESFDYACQRMLGAMDFILQIDPTVSQVELEKYYNFYRLALAQLLLV